METSQCTQLPTTARDVAARGLPSGRLRLLIIGDGSVATYPLPDSGEVSFGRAESNDVQIEDASISRRHALLHVGVQVTLEDLGSTNGTLVRGASIVPGERVLLHPGEVVDLGSVMVVLQQRLSQGAPPDFDARVKDGALSAVGEISHDTRTVPLRQTIMRDLHRLVARIAPGSLSVLLQGETGAGKEVIAETMHHLSTRADKPFLRLNCAALSETLLESELFGHERGAFTGAVQAKPGLLESAHGGTVLLDEIGELPMSVQVKLLRVLEERQVRRVGGLQPRSFDVRFISATNRDLESEVATGRFRQDLYFRLNGVLLVVPPLRHRVAEIKPLAEEFLAQFAQKAGHELPPRLAPDALSVLERYSWPGNVRELRNMMERAVLLCGREPVRPEHLPESIVSSSDEHPRDALSGARDAAQLAAQLPGRAQPAGAGLRQRLSELEREQIIEALRQCAGNQTEAARLLGMCRRTLVSRLKTYGIPRPRAAR